MAKKANNEDNLKKFQGQIKRHVMDELAEEGLKLLAEEEKANPSPATPQAVPPIADKKRLDNVLSEMSSNPYIKARIKVLKKYPDWLQKELEIMEQKGDTNNRHYEQFVKEVISLGDSLSNK